MQYKSLRRSGVQVSRLALGTMNFGMLTDEATSFGPWLSTNPFMFAATTDKSPAGQAALEQKAGRITTAGMTREVAFELVQGAINDRIDDAYRAKYKRSPYLKPMIGERARSATVKITPRDV